MLLPAGLLWLTGCAGSPTGSGGGAATTAPAGADDSGRISDIRRDYPLDELPTTTVTIGDHVFRAWLAQDFDPNRPGVVQEGLMHVPPEEIANDQGMLFAFRDERVRGFWMLNTITPLDIAYARTDGTIVSIRQMPAYSLQTFSSVEPAMFALEVKQGTFDRLGITAGDRMEIPADVLVVRP